MKSSLDIFYLNPVPFDVSTLLVKPPDTAVEKAMFKTHWDRMGETRQVAPHDTFFVHLCVQP